MRVERCRNDNINVLFDTGYEEVIAHLEDSSVQIQTRTPHMSICASGDQQFIVKSDRLVFPMDDVDAAEELAEDLLGDLLED